MTRSWQNSDRRGRRSSSMLSVVVAPTPSSIFDVHSSTIVACDRNAFFVCRTDSEPSDCPFESAPDDVEQDSSGVVQLGFVPVGVLLPHRAASQDPAHVRDNMERSSHRLFRSLIRSHQMDALPNSTPASHHRNGAIDTLLGVDRHSLHSFLQRSRAIPFGALVAMRWLDTQTPLQHVVEVIQRISDFLGGERYSGASTFATCGTRVMSMSSRWAPPIADLPGFTMSHNSSSFSSIGTG